MIDLRRPDDWSEPVRLPDLPSPIARVLVPFDGSHAAELALAYAGALAANVDAEIVVVVAFDPPITVRRRGVLMVEHLRAEYEAEARELADESAELLRARGRTAKGIVVRGDVVTAILETADIEQSDIVILGRRGLSAEMAKASPLHHHGGVAEKVARRAPMPVLLVG